MSYYNNVNQGGGGNNYYGSQQQQGQQQSNYQQPTTQSTSSAFHQEYGDVNSWQQQHYGQQPQQQQQPYGSYPMQQQPPQQQPAAASNMMNSFWDPSTATKMAAIAMNMSSNNQSGNSNNEAMMFNLAGEASKSLLQSKSAQLLPSYIEQIMFTLRYYFAVDNNYVLLKMKRILFPFLYKHWKRQQKDPSSSPSDPLSSSATTMASSSYYQVPLYDDCAPDLYLPIMSGITYVLIASFLTGTVGKFNPQVIPSITTYCFLIQLLEVSCIRLGFYLMQSHVAILDLFSYTGYKYFGLCLNMLIAMMIGRHGLNLLMNGGGGIRTYYICFVWTASALSYFMLKTMANNIPLHTSPNGPKREIMVLLFAASQFITMWLMSQTKFL